jgi:ribulose-5-phosphate 4-epimerase/fuculose-1-phosphate aldolase
VSPWRTFRSCSAHHTSEAEELAAVCRGLAAAGLSPGSSGNVSVRIRDGFLATPTGRPLGTLAPRDLSVLDGKGSHRAGPPPTKEVSLHLRLHALNPRTRAVVHLHSPYAVAAACLEPDDPASALPPYTPYAVMRLGPAVPLLPYAAPGSAQLAALADGLPAGTRACLLANHGSLTVAGSLDTAAQAAVELEESARLHLLLAPRTDVRLLTPEQCAPLH